MNTDFDGGPAFPHLMQHNQRVNESEIYPGLSIRDWFAGHALAGWVATWPKDAKWPVVEPERITNLAADFYALADAMLTERKKGCAS